MGVSPVCQNKELRIRSGPSGSKSSGIVPRDHRRALWLFQKKPRLDMNIIQQLEAEQAAKIEAKRKLPEFSPGDTLRVNVTVKEGNRTRVQASPFARSPTAKASSAYSLFTRRSSKASKSSVAVRFVAPSSTTCATVAASLLVSSRTPAPAPASSTMPSALRSPKKRHASRLKRLQPLRLSQPRRPQPKPAEAAAAAEPSAE